MKNIKARVYITALLIAISCQPIAAINLKTEPTASTISQPLTHQQILTYLIMAELAMQRNMPETALENYMLVVKSTRDPAVAQLATDLAVQLQLSAQALAAAEIWASGDKTNLQAQLVAVTLFVNNDPNKTQEFLNNAFLTNNLDIDQHLLLIINKLSASGQKNLTQAIFKLAATNNTNPYILLAAAQIASVQLDIEEANKYLKLALQIKPDLTSAIELNAKLIRHEKNNDQPALTYLEQQVKKHPKDSELRMFYVTALTDNNLFTQATPQLEILIKDPNFGGDAAIMLGELYITQKNYAQAEKTIKQALVFEQSRDKASYYLGQLAEFNNNNKQAISWYENVSESSEFNVPAFLRAAYLYSTAGDYPKALNTLQNSNPVTFLDQKQILLSQIDVYIDSNNYEQALDNCNSALNIISDDVDFLYARSVVNGLLHHHLEVEKDLRAILALEPNNANALNALGFTLANQPARIKEAMPLLQKAISLNPNNPVYMDSMGWLLYRMGKNQESIIILKKAYQLSDDNEIAAHFGEVLWANGNKDEAKSVWSKALMTTPENQKIIHETLLKLKIPLSELKPLKTAN